MIWFYARCLGDGIIIAIVVVPVFRILKSESQQHFIFLYIVINKVVDLRWTNKRL